MIQTMPGRHTEAVAWVTVATAIFTVILASGKLTGGQVSAFQILFLRYVGGVATCLILVAIAREPVWRTDARRVATHAARTGCGALSGACAIHAAAEMPIADATAIGLLDGAMAVLLGIVLLREAVGGRQWLAIGVSVAGAAVVTLGNGAFGQIRADDVVPAAVALLGAGLGALEAVLLRMLAVAERPVAVLFFVNLLGLVLLAAPGLLTWRTGADAGGFVFVLLGPFAVLAQYCNIRGFRLAPVAVVGPVGYSWIVFAALLGLFAFGEVPSAATLAGAALIVAGGVMLARLPNAGGSGTTPRSRRRSPA